jgi:hypothetical protein
MGKKGIRDCLEKVFDKSRLFYILAFLILLAMTIFITNEVLLLFLSLVTYISYFILIRIKKISFNDGVTVRFFWHTFYAGFIIYNMSNFLVNISSLKLELLFLIESLLIIAIIYFPVLITKVQDKGLLLLQRTVFYFIIVLMIIVIIVFDNSEFDEYLDFFWLLPILEMLGILVYRLIIEKMNLIVEST